MRGSGVRFLSSAPGYKALFQMRAFQFQHQFILRYHLNSLCFIALRIKNVLWTFFILRSLLFSSIVANPVARRVLVRRRHDAAGGPEFMRDKLCVSQFTYSDYEKSLKFLNYRTFPFLFLRTFYCNILLNICGNSLPQKFQK